MHAACTKAETVNAWFFAKQKQQSRRWNVGNEIELCLQQHHRNDAQHRGGDYMKLHGNCWHVIKPAALVIT